LNQSRQQVSGATLAWQSSTPRIAEVSTAGVLRAVAPGTADIVAMSGGVRRKLSVVVGRPRARKVSVESRSARVLVGDSVEITVRASNKYGLTIANVRPQWSAAPSALGTVSNAGFFTGRAPGPALIVASIDGAADTVAIEVEERPAPQPVPQPVIAATRTVVAPTPTPADSGRAKAAAPPLSRDAAIRLFDPLVAAINSGSSDRIGQVYTTPADPGDARLQRDFLKFVRTDSPRANTESAAVQSTGADASTIVATIGLVWTNNAAIKRQRPATFTGTATRLPNGEWRLTGIRLQQKVW
jgi:hypothetical protein